VKPVRAPDQYAPIEAMYAFQRHSRFLATSEPRVHWVTGFAAWVSPVPVLPPRRPEGSKPKIRARIRTMREPPPPTAIRPPALPLLPPALLTDAPEMSALSRYSMSGSLRLRPKRTGSA